MGNFENRAAIRKTYGQEDHVKGKVIRTLFFVGIGARGDVQKRLAHEMAMYKDIIQADFVDDYYNNTIKTMMTFRWLYDHCPNAKHCLFTDDDMYISAVNLLQYVESEYTDNGTGDSQRRLLAGYVFESAPQRFRSSKWRVSLEEYPWDRWPPYVTAGAYVVSSTALRAIYAASLYVQHFRFDDIYIGIVARKLNLRPTHCPRFHFYKKSYTANGYKDVIASHGYSNPDELISVWREQNAPT